VANKSFKTLTFGLLALSTSLFVGCMGNDIQGTDDQYATLSVSVGTGDVNAAAKAGLSKGSTITLSKLIITMVSNSNNPTASDTIRDTIRAGVNQGFVGTSTANQTVDSAYVLKALRTWYITAKTLDARDSVIHTKTDTLVNLLAGETRSKSLSLSPRFVMYKANFNFPDSLATLATSIKQKMTVKRLVMKVNGVTVVDSSAAFLPSTAYSISYDYVTVNTGTTVELSVIGSLTLTSGTTADTVLYRKTDIAVSAIGPGTDGSQTTTLPYVGPVTGIEDLSVTIVKVGLYQITVETDDTVVPKK
jgi:hypothetical protein